MNIALNMFIIKGKRKINGYMAQSAVIVHSTFVLEYSFSRRNIRFIYSLGYYLFVSVLLMVASHFTLSSDAY